MLYLFVMQFTIYGELTDLNTYINQERANKYLAAKTKREETERVAWTVKAKNLKPIKGKVNARYTIFTKNNRKDEDNYLIYLKWISDGMVAAGLLPDDSPKYLHIESVQIINDGEPKTIVELEEA